MVGEVVSWNPYKDTGFIKDESSGVEYFLHKSEVKNSKHIRVGNIVQFESVNEGKDHEKAVNVVKVGHGPAHPFIKDLERISESIKNSNLPDDEKLYRTADIQMLINYFTKIRDVRIFPNARKMFRPQVNVENKNEENNK